MMNFSLKNGRIHIIYEYLLSLMKFIKKLISYFLKKKDTDELDLIIEEVKKIKDPFIYK
jgi:flagellin-specific chaperone FliS